MASVESAETTSAVCAAAQAPKRPASAKAVENCVPLISASPSLGPSVTGSSPASASAFRPGRMRPATSASPAPIITAAMWASGARSPEAPTEPCAGTTGVTPCASMPSRSATTSHRTPDAPRPSDRSFSAIISRTTPRGTGAPTPQQCDRIRLR